MFSSIHNVAIATLGAIGGTVIKRQFPIPYSLLPVACCLLITNELPRPTA
ncbi:MAG: hypothetical protein AB4426_11400 [Xenococcaceae cyanobacterium]